MIKKQMQKRKESAASWEYLKQTMKISYVLLEVMGRLLEAVSVAFLF
jgi:hypothetical protein